MLQCKDITVLTTNLSAVENLAIFNDCYAFSENFLAQSFESII